MKKYQNICSFLWAVIFLLFFFLFEVGCQTAPKQTRLMSTVEEVDATMVEMKIRTHRFEARFSGIVEMAADEILERSSDPEIRENALMWKMYAIPAAQYAIFQQDPLAPDSDTDDLSCLGIYCSFDF